MGCGSSKSTATEKIESSSTEKINEPAGVDTKKQKQQHVTDLINSENSFKSTKNKEQKDTDQIAFNENLPSHPVQHVEEKPIFATSSVNVQNEVLTYSDHHSELEDLLAGATVFDVLQNIQLSSQVAIENDEENKNAIKRHVAFDLDTQSEASADKLIENETTPIPSAHPTDGESSRLANGTELFLNALHKACPLMDNSRLVKLSIDSESFRLDRTFYCFDRTDLLSNIMSKMDKIHILDLRGGQCGPVAFRAIVNALINDDHIKKLNLSDNLANPECSEILGQLLFSNKSLEHLNVSGNMLGKDAFSRYVGAGLLKNPFLQFLDFSSCGATDLHCLCESLRNSTCTNLSTLLASHNQMADGHQFAVDLSLLLESGNCKLKVVDVTNTNISSSGMNAIISSIKTNKSLEQMEIGQNSVADISKLGELLLNVAAHEGMTKIELNKTKIEEDSFFEDIFKTSDLRRTSKLTHIGVADCGLTDFLVQKLVLALDGKLPKLEFLDISNNNDLSLQSVQLFNKICLGNLRSLRMALLERLDGVSSCFSHFPSLGNVDFTRSRINHTELDAMSLSCQQTFKNITLNGVKLSGTQAIKSVMSSKCFSTLTSLNLSGCQLNDLDVEPISNAVEIKSPVFPIMRIDLSVNRLSSVFLSTLSEALLLHGSHPLIELNLANNEVDDTGMEDFTKIFQSSTHESRIKNINLSCNNISASSVINFFSIFKTRKFILSFLDLRNQKEKYGEEEMEILASCLNEVFGKQNDSVEECRHTINLCGLGGSDVPTLCSLDSSAIKTDFVNSRKSTIALNDILCIGKGINILNSQQIQSSPYRLSAQTWNSIVGKDAPKWASVSTELEKSCYISHTPGTVTQQRLQGMLEMEADCVVKDVFLVKDPIMRKPTGTAWVLFEDIKSKSNALDWYTSGGAQMYRTPFLISEVPVGIQNETANAGSIAEHEIANREVEQKRKEEEDRRMMDESAKLAAERAEYRAAHPAYQGGRIS